MQIHFKTRQPLRQPCAFRSLFAIHSVHSISLKISKISKISKIEKIEIIEIIEIITIYPIIPNKSRNGCNSRNSGELLIQWSIAVVGPRLGERGDGTAAVELR